MNCNTVHVAIQDLNAKNRKEPRKPVINQSDVVQVAQK